MIAAVLFALLFTVTPSIAQEPNFSGVPSIHDGDTLTIGATRVRLWGIDAPEDGQRCRRPEGEHDCGEFATLVLKGLINGQPVKCGARDRDRYGRTVASCTVDGVDLGSMMVTLGWAVDFTRYSHGAYAMEEEQARHATRGMWAGEFQRPEDWRREHRR